MPMERLAYRNRFVRELVQNLEGYVAPTEPPVPQVISGPDNTIVLQVSFEEWERLLSSVYTGADICYPEISDTVRWVLLRAVEQPVSICDMIINCINTNPATRAALRDFVLNDEAIQQMIQNQINAGKPINPEIGILQNDDLDALFGAVTFLVDTIHDAIVDFNQDSEASTNSRELGQIIFEAIPIVETLPFNEVSDYIDTLYNQIIEVFDSQWDTTPITGTRDRIRCALFCIARDNGNGLTWDLIQDYFYQRTGFNWSTTLNIMLEFANFVATGTWSGEEVVDISFGNFAAAMSGMGKFGEMLFPSLTSIMRLGQNNPDSDWGILCEECGEDCDEYDFTTSEHGFAPLLTGYGVYVPGEGWARGTGTDWGRCGLQAAIGNYTSVTFEMNMVADNPTSFVGLLEYPYPPYVEEGPYENMTGLTSITVTRTVNDGGLAFDLGTTVSNSSVHPLPEGWRLTKIIVCR